MTAFDYLIVGAGYSGCVLAERIASQLDKKVLIVDKRNHIAGNAFDYFDEHGILVHKYGPHLFHTNDEKVFGYLSRFTGWRKYEHRVVASVNGQLLPIPINMDTLNRLYGLDLRTPEDVQRYYDRVKEPITNPKNSEELVLSQVGRDLYEKFFRGYTMKQWGLNPKELAASVTARIPIRTNRDDRYFEDKYQALPIAGYTKMFENMIRHPNIHVLLQTDYHDVIDCLKFDRMVYTGPLDEYFDYCHGSLPYRSLRFEQVTIDEEFFNPCTAAQINYPNEHEYTRITEWKKITGQKYHKSTITREYPMLAKDGMEKYYPIPRRENHDIADKYKRELEKLKTVLFCGRLADYKYYNMDQVVARALHLFDTRVTATASVAG